MPASIHSSGSVQGAEVTPEVVTEALQAGIGYMESVQAEEGMWPGDYGGPMFLMPGLLIALYVSKSLNAVLSKHHQASCSHDVYQQLAG